MEIKTGLYKHSKSGKMYKVLGTGHHSETLEELVVYQAEYDSPEFGKNAIWVRPIEMFIEKVNVNGEDKPRFEFVK